jgi:hypothetical protein
MKGGKQVREKGRGEWERKIDRKGVNNEEKRRGRMGKKDR